MNIEEAKHIVLDSPEYQALAPKLEKQGLNLEELLTNALLTVLPQRNYYGVPEYLIERVVKLLEGELAKCLARPATTNGGRLLRWLASFIPFRRNK